MKQRKFTILIIISLFLLIFISCEKEDINIDIMSNSWELVKMKKQGENSYIKANETYILKFTSDTTYTLNLDVNNCGGHYEILNSGNIDISAMGCTEICCDSEFSVDLSLLFPKMAEYYGSSDELIFNGQGTIILRPH